MARGGVFDAPSNFRGSHERVRRHGRARGVPGDWSFAAIDGRRDRNRNEKRWARLSSSRAARRSGRDSGDEADERKEEADA